AWLLANGYRGQVDLIYIDPPFDSGADYVRRVRLRGVEGTGRLEGESYSLGEQVQYTDIWANDAYLQFMYERLILLEQLLSEEGFIFLHTDWHKTHLLRCLLDEIFSAENFRNEIIVRRGRKKNLQKQFEGIDKLGVETDTILLYSKDPSAKLSLLTTPDRGAEEQWQSFWRGNVERPTMQYEVLGFDPDHGQLMWGKGRGLRAAENYKSYLDWSRENPDQTLLDYWRETGEELEFVRYREGASYPEYWVPPKDEGILGNEWLDVQGYAYSYGYKTEKHEALITRILELASEPGDVVLDCFVGSGTTAAVAQKMGRRWVAADINKGAIQTTSKRLQTIIQEQIDAGAKAQQTAMEFAEEGEQAAPPAALSFSVYRVNDYDLQIQHNEAVDLAVEHIGIERTLTDSYFDGTLGQRLVKIAPFNHPLTLLDLQGVKDEVEARNDQRDIVVVCLGKETAVDPWLEKYNKNRPVNQIEVIELRTDQKYGKFFVHQPAQAEIDVRREDDKILVKVEDFISPSIVERLEMDTPLFRAQIPDWRAMVDCVMIDLDYDGEVFGIALSDVPERRDDLVRGRYELDAPDGEITVAVKIIDMLGEEVLVTEEI
ncbi:MAG: DNA methyltransferase, partial [bacterium]